MTDYTLDQLEDMAIRQDPVPELNSQAQILLYQSLRNLYWYARQSGITREQGRLEKQRILDSYRINKFLEELNEDTQTMWKRIEQAACAYRMAPSVELADKLMKALYRVESVKPVEQKEAKHEDR